LLKKLFPLFSYIKYWLKKEDSYSLQSPFIFKIYQDLLDHINTSSPSIEEIEFFRETLLKSNKKIEVLDLGAGSKKVNTRKRKVSDITKHSTSSKKFALLYQFFCQLTPAENVIELGTCMGISTRYLSLKTNGKLYSFEGSAEIQSVAKPVLNYSNIQFILGNITDKLPSILSKIETVDFALIDANHTYNGTLYYFNLILAQVKKNTIVAIGDIHWSIEMEKAWGEIKSNPKVRLSLDFYECGVLFFDPSIKKSEYILDF
jgi:predicted O-methyltransferase YrrM